MLCSGQKVLLVAITCFQRELKHFQRGGPARLMRLLCSSVLPSWVNLSSCSTVHKQQVTRSGMGMDRVRKGWRQSGVMGGVGGKKGEAVAVMALAVGGSGN